jgi:hypothetical protein
MPTLSTAQIRRERTGATAPRKRSPGARSVQGQLTLYGLKNRIIGRHYVWVYMGNANSVAQYRASGYIPSTWDLEKRAGKVLMVDGMPKIRGLEPVGAMPDPSDDGKPIRIADFILFSCDRQRKADIDEYGHDGMTGQVMADEIEGRLIAHKNGNDPLRGLKGFNRGKHIDVGEYDESDLRHGHTSEGL